MDATEQIRSTLAWMIAEMNFRREQTGMEDAPSSPEMLLAMELLRDIESGQIECRRVQ